MLFFGTICLSGRLLNLPIVLPFPGPLRRGGDQRQGGRCPCCPSLQAPWRCQGWAGGSGLRASSDLVTSPHCVLRSRWSKPGEGRVHSAGDRALREEGAVPSPGPGLSPALPPVAVWPWVIQHPLWTSSKSRLCPSLVRCQLFTLMSLFLDP